MTSHREELYEPKNHEMLRFLLALKEESSSSLKSDNSLKRSVESPTDTSSVHQVKGLSKIHEVPFSDEVNSEIIPEKTPVAIDNMDLQALIVVPKFISEVPNRESCIKNNNSNYKGSLPEHPSIINPKKADTISFNSGCLELSAGVICSEPPVNVKNELKIKQLESSDSVDSHHSNEYEDYELDTKGDALKVCLVPSGPDCPQEVTNS